jgi:hypothetical protein
MIDNGVILYIASASGWWKQSFRDIETAHNVLEVIKRVSSCSWAICPISKDDGGLIPPPSVPIHKLEATS